MSLKPDSTFALHADRNPAVLGPLRFLEYEHLRNDALRNFSSKFADLAKTMLDALPDDPELTLALHKLREAKDRAVGLAAVTWVEPPVVVSVQPTDLR